MSTSKLRRPNFHAAKTLQSKHSTNANDASIRSFARSRSSAASSGQLTNYTRQCHERIILAERDTAAFDIYEDDGSSAQRIDEETTNNSNHGTTTTTTATNSENNDTKKKNDPSMDQCIILLEPSLKMFQSSCIQNERARAKRNKTQGDQGKETRGMYNQKENAIEDDDDNDDDEVPPQLLRLARFFHFRWIPMKKALLRQPPSSSSLSSSSLSNHEKSTNKSSPNDVEMSIHYRLRLAKACWKKGLVAAAEYESLKGAFDDSSSGEKKKNNKNKRKDNDDDDDGDDNSAANAKGRGGDDEFRKRYKADKSLEEGSESESRHLMERVRLSLMRLPTDAIRPERSLAAWRHVKEMILECCHHWAKRDDDFQRQRLKQQRQGGNLQDGEIGLEALTPDQVVDWTMTSWTALLLSQGMECFTVATTTTKSTTHHPVGDNSIASVEKHLATLLSDRSSSNNPTLTLARAASLRIDDLLSPKNLRHLNGTHIYSLGKLLATFHSREDAEVHIVTSICKCSSAGGGMMGLEQLARLFAVYTCCISATTANSADFDDALVGRKTEGRRAVREFEGRLIGKLDDDGIMKTITLEEEDSIQPKKQIHNRGDMTVKAKSFLDAVLHATAHLVKCC